MNTSFLGQKRVVESRIEKPAEEITAVCAHDVVVLKEARGSISLSEASTDDESEGFAAKEGLSSHVLSSCPRDTSMVSGFLAYLGYSSMAEGGGSGSALRLLLKVVKILRHCKYDSTDIASVFAVAALHHKFFLTRHLVEMSWTERIFILLAQIYIAHCVVLDEYCCVSNWHKYLFASYCDLKSLNSAVARILKKLDWSLHVSTDEVAELVNTSFFSCPPRKGGNEKIFLYI
jgi:hypothetical protein